MKFRLETQLPPSNRNTKINWAFKMTFLILYSNIHSTTTISFTNKSCKMNYYQKSFVQDEKRLPQSRPIISSHPKFNNPQVKIYKIVKKRKNETDIKESLNRIPYRLECIVPYYQRITPKSCEWSEWKKEK